MTEIKTAQAWGDTYETDVEGIILLELDDDIEMEIPYSDARVPVVIVHGMTEAEVHEAAALLEKSKEVCEWRNVDECTFSQSCQSLVDYECEDVPRLCPSCGRKVVVRE